MTIVGFLERRKYKGISSLPRFIISWFIYKFQGTYTHTFISYYDENVLKVRDMDTFGVEHIEYNEYLKKHSDRGISLIKLKKNTKEFNEYCKNKKAKYDFINLIIVQPIRILFNFVINKKTVYRRTCSEDTARCLNVLYPNLIDNPELVSPTELYKIFKKWTIHN